MPWAIAITVGSLLVLLWAEARVARPLGATPQNRLFIWLSKPLASCGFLLACLGSGALDSLYGRLVLTAQVLAWIGDVLLIPKRQGTFIAGLVAFLLGHVAYTAAFLTRTFDLMAATITLAVLSVVGWWVHRWLMAHVPRTLRMPVSAYIMISTIMVSAAVGAAPVGHTSTLLLSGALFFYLSDLCVARHEFVEKVYLNKMLGLPLYYAAQLLLASTVAS